MYCDLKLQETSKSPLFVLTCLVQVKMPEQYGDHIDWQKKSRGRWKQQSLVAKISMVIKNMAHSKIKNTTALNCMFYWDESPMTRI